MIGKSRYSESTVINIVDQEIPSRSNLRRLMILQPPSDDNRIKEALRNAIIKRIMDDTTKVGGKFYGRDHWPEYEVANDNDKAQVEAWENYNHYRNKFLNIFPDKRTTLKYNWILGRLFFLSELNEGEIVIEKPYEDLVRNFLTLSKAEYEWLDSLGNDLDTCG